MQFKQQYCEEEEAFVQQTVTCNETCMYHYLPVSKHQNIGWKYMSLARTKKFRSAPSASKMMLMLFWDFNGPILEHYQNHGQTVNRTWYCAMLGEELKPAIYSKCREMPTEEVVLHHENT
jgi:hypothetical protein